MRMSTRFYPSILGAAFAQLPAAVRAAHATATLMRGTVSVERGTSWLARLAAWLAGFPAPCVDAPCSVAFEVYGAGERWRRDMNGSIYVSTLTPAPEAACFDERFPLYSFRFRIEADAQGARFVLLRHHVCGIPVPRRFWPRVTTYESEENGRYAFAVEARTFRDQMLVRYSGVLLPV